MRRLLWQFCFAAAAVVVVAPGVRARQAPSADDLMKLAGEYVDKYTTGASGVSLEEMFLLTNTSGGSSATPERISSDVVLVKLDKDVVGLRDPFAIDKRALRDHQPRLLQALENPTAANWDLAQKYVRENANLLLHNVVVWYADPMMALQFASTANQANLTYKLEGTKKMNGITVSGVAFKERADGPRVLASIPGNAQSAGRLWIDPATGAIHMTELWVQSQTDVVRLQVMYAPDAKLGLLVPRKAADTFEWREAGNNFTTTMGAMPMKLSFQADVEYTNPQYTPLDLNRSGK